MVLSFSSMTKGRFVQLLLVANIGFTAFIIFGGVLLWQFAQILPLPQSSADNNIRTSQKAVLGLQTSGKRVLFLQYQDGQANILEAKSSVDIQAVLSFEASDIGLVIDSQVALKSNGDLIYLSKNLDEYIVYNYNTDNDRSEIYRTLDKLVSVEINPKGLVTVLAIKAPPVNSNPSDVQRQIYRLIELGSDNLPKILLEFDSPAKFASLGVVNNRLLLQDPVAQDCINFDFNIAQLVTTTCTQQSQLLQPQKFVAVKNYLPPANYVPSSFPVSFPQSPAYIDFQESVYITSEWASYSIAKETLTSEQLVSLAVPKKYYQGELNQELEIVVDTAESLVLTSEEALTKTRQLAQINLSKTVDPVITKLAASTSWEFLGQSPDQQLLYFNLKDSSANSILNYTYTYELSSQTLVPLQLPACRLGVATCTLTLLQ